MTVVLVPGLAVSRYLRNAVVALTGRGVPVWMPPAPGAPGVAADLREYGGWLGRALPAGTETLVGVSVGCQAAVLAAAATPVAHLLLISPTVDPRVRSGPRLAAAWLRGTTAEPPRLGLEQVPDWRRAGARRLSAVIASALRVRIEDTLGRLDCPVTVVHGEMDSITSHAYAAALAGGSGRRLVVVPGATHSWPYADEDRFADLVEGVLR